MMRMKTKKTKGMSALNGDLAGGVGGSEVLDWELRPGGMLVQKRDPDSDRVSVAPTIRVKVKYGSSYHEIYVSSQASFGELKKLLTAPTGLHHEDQKLMFKDKERQSNAYLDIVGVKDGSKLVLVEDPISREKRYLEMRKNAKMEKASKSISEISLEVDNLAAQVSALESVISKGGKVAETDVLNLIELLMNQLIKLDGIIADGDVKMQRRMQVKRVQKYVETLDLLKVRNAMSSSNYNGKINGGQMQQQQQQQQKQKHSTGEVAEQMPSPKPKPMLQQQLPRHSTGKISSLRQQSQQPVRHSASGTVVTTQWETFEFDVPASSTSTAGATGTQSQSQKQSPPSKFSWDFFHQ
ncbi:BAG family molecular chaperone regulator 3-like [Macadamia integrifolia]|uniref:BAG family molecular chaperone regulator 3-like n=1 Tax=Macadamia integrifolia TaxID=60698 RepID=UPI001C4E43E7|nr:BAG family molecular chaperone regulator 3-like [Macadamia integrifolia]XP_042510192.1 BAG family molecular chaperone regulator 3-like [Macadamia integrifolia]XP_042510193.1 BAG family molecular chaperone regulator 3-like [Macadamia integrifolia]XP_042510194.1 BAG family molecular chaperone regulator 3-like [Macadamia integrifolia]